jgi:hypothetical protein
MACDDGSCLSRELAGNCNLRTNMGMRIHWSGPVTTARVRLGSLLGIAICEPNGYAHSRLAQLNARNVHQPLLRRPRSVWSLDQGLKRSNRRCPHSLVTRETQRKARRALSAANNAVPTAVATARSRFALPPDAEIFLSRRIALRHQAASCCASVTAMQYPTPDCNLRGPRSSVPAYRCH